MNKIISLTTIIGLSLLINAYSGNFDSEKDRIEVESNPGIAHQISSDQGHESGEREIGSEFENAPITILKKFDDLIYEGKFEDAAEYGNKALEYWTSECDEKIQHELDYKLILAIIMDSKYYYEILKSKISNITHEDIVQNFSKYLDNIPLKHGVKGVSITDYLSNRAYINPEFLDKFNISLEDAHRMLEMDLYELAKKSDITFSILHSIALHAKQDPYFRFDICTEDPLGSPNTTGRQVSVSLGYWVPINRISIHHPLASKLFRGDITHEWTHQLMYILFDNFTEPYRAEDEKAKVAWNSVCDKIWNKLDEAPYVLKNKDLLNPSTNYYERVLSGYNRIKTSYHPNNYSKEMIAKFSEMIGCDTYEDPKVREFLEPIYEYWMQYISPAIEEYLQEYADIDTFISDWERERVLDPLYRIDTKRKEYAMDLKKVQNEAAKAPALSEKWYLRGNLNHAKEIDKIITLEENLDLIDCLDLAEKWHKRGNFEIAEEFEKIGSEIASKAIAVSENYDLETATVEEDRIEAEARPEISDVIADKWYNRGEVDIALEFDFIYLEEWLCFAKKITKKWYKRGEKDAVREIIWNKILPWWLRAKYIADEWYEQGEKEMALEFDKLFLKFYDYNRNEIIEKWEKRGERI